MTSNPLHIAAAHGWPLIKLSKPTDPGQSPGKRPMGNGWQKQDGLTVERAQQLLNQGHNIGILCGGRSRLLVLDIDGDRPEGLPETATVQTGSGGLHLYYHVPEGIDLPKANKCGKVAPSVDVRYTGAQVVYPPSVHAETGALYEWIKTPDQTPIVDVPQWVLDKLTRPELPGVSSSYLDAALRGACDDICNAPQGQRNDTLNTKAYHLGGLPFTAWQHVERELLNAALDAGLTESEARATIKSGLNSGKANPQTVSTKPPPRPTVEVESPAPRVLADKYLDDYHPRGTLRYWRGEWYKYDGTRYRVFNEDMMRAHISEVLCTWVYPHRDETREIKQILRNGLLADVIGQLRQTRTIIDSDFEQPLWLSGHHKYHPGACVALKNGILHLHTRELMPHSPDFFCTTRFPFEYTPKAPSPEVWIDFLTKTWPGDSGIACAELLAEWFGYVISRDMSHHKMLWIIGPSRGGKGLISRILEALLGEENTCNPTLGSLGDRHGGQVLIDKRLAIIGDARMSRRTDQAAITERLLSLSGGDKQTFPRKYLNDWTGRPAIKFMLLSNDLPILTDASGALTGRLLMLQTIESYLGREDHSIEPRIKRNELPGVFNWALSGLDRLNKNMRFTEPDASRNIIAGFRAISSPVTQFIAECCEIGDEYAVNKETLYGEYAKWCELEGLPKVCSRARFFQALKSAYPKLQESRPRDWDGTRNRVISGVHLAFNLRELSDV